MECFNSVTEAMSELDTKGKLEAIREQGRIGAIITDFKNVESEGTNGIQSVMQKYPEIPVLMLASAKHYHGVVESFEKSLPTLRELEKKYIKHVLNKTGGRKEKAAKLLGLNRRTLYRKEREYGRVKGGVQS
jgi:DNA-binding NtrC family response regulator